MSTIVKRFEPGSLLLPSDVNQMQEDTARSVELYRELVSGSARLDAPAGGGPYLLGAALTGGITAASAAAGLCVFRWDPEWVAESEPVKRTTYLRIRATLLTNATAPAITFTTGLYPVTAAGGAASTVSVTLGSVITGSTVAFASPAKETLGNGHTEDFAAPAAGYYALAVAVSGSAAASSSVAVRAAVQVHEI